LERALDSIPPATGAEVMGTTIVSIALSLDGQETLSRALLVIAALIWVILAVLLPFRAAREPARFCADAGGPYRCGGHRRPRHADDVARGMWTGIAALVIAFVVWVALLTPVAERVEDADGWHLSGSSRCPPKR